jgi:hypothetical protein
MNFSPHTDSMIFTHNVRNHQGCKNKRSSILFLKINIHETSNAPWILVFSLMLFFNVISRCEVYTHYTSKRKLIIIKVNKGLSNPTSKLDESIFLTIKYIKKKIPIVELKSKNKFRLVHSILIRKIAM